MSEMGTFRIEVDVENPVRPGERRRITGALVDTGAELSSFPAQVLEALGPLPWLDRTLRGEPQRLPPERIERRIRP